MRQFLFPRRPLARATVLNCHLLLQLGLLGATALWLVPRLSWLRPSVEANSAWPTLAMAGGLWLLAAVTLRLLAELCLLPHHIKAQRPGFAPGAVVTRSWERRPAVHDNEAAWTSEARHVDAEEESALGSPRVVRPAERYRPPNYPGEPALDLALGDQPEPAWSAQPLPGWDTEPAPAWAAQPVPAWDTQPSPAWDAQPEPVATREPLI
ncbi:hypothetical protein [Halomonas aquatica]|uniref:Uncharacterized protein n=1 Tax=Halomonas aquatica TaxID=3151123 RepID=A0ABV1NIX8_9GAMM